MSQKQGDFPDSPTIEHIVDDPVIAHLRRAGALGGKVGGRSTSDAKREAVRANLEKARAARWPSHTRLNLPSRDADTDIEMAMEYPEYVEDELPERD